MSRFKLLGLALSLTLFISTPYAASINEIQISWDAAINADGYRVFYGTSTLNYTDTIDLALVTEVAIIVPTDGIPYFIALKAFNEFGEGGFSREISGLPRAEVDSVVADCITTTGVSGVQCVAAILGFNFDPLAVASITYAGVTVTSSTRIDSNTMEVAFSVVPSAVSGQTDLIITQPWLVTPGTAPLDDDGVTGGDVVTISADDITIIPIILPDTPGRLKMKKFK